MTAPTEKDLEILERTHVQSVYEAIAPHFSATRYKPWPVVESFLKELPTGSIGADVGCGNGKYLGVNKELYTIGSDMAVNFASIVNERGFEAMVCDNLSLPYRPSSFDFVVSIAVIHHFSSFERRVAAVKELIRILKPGGKVLIFVWALEQEDGSKRRFEKQDVFVPWNLDKKSFGGKKKEERKSKKEVLEEEEAKKKEEALSHGFTALALNPEEAEPKLVVKSGNENIVYQRFYHVFVKGELDQVVEAAGGVEITTSGYDRDNWYVIATKL
ncbi:UNVERIFIED_CONTAM: tRNA methyltransferase, has a role in tRNA modification [Siphonaria sp. JEL0065]|nr:tRNA methyltransferase, has a role in tRNA modification [Siphonaria sp. JEL0065]